MDVEALLVELLPLEVVVGLGVYHPVFVVSVVSSGSLGLPPDSTVHLLRRLCQGILVLFRPSLLRFRSYFTTISFTSNHIRYSRCRQPENGNRIAPPVRPPTHRGHKLLRQSVANKQALPCWPKAPPFLLQVSGHVFLTVQTLLHTQESCRILDG